MRRTAELIAFIALVAVVALRPLVHETYDSALTGFDQALEGLSNPTPLRTLVFDLVILAACCVWLLARDRNQPMRYRRTGLEWGLAVIVVAGAASSLFAGNKFLALNGSLDWVSLPLLTIVLTQLMRAPWQRRFLLAAIIGSASVQAFECYGQYTSGFDETWAHYQSIKDDFWSRQGVHADSSRVFAFEARLKAREASGTMPHGNVTGGYLLLTGFAALAAAHTGWKRLRAAVSPVAVFAENAHRKASASRAASARADVRVRESPDTPENARPPKTSLILLCLLFFAKFAMAAGLFAAMCLTGSLAAIVAAAVGVAAWILLAWLRDRIQAFPIGSFLMGWCLILLCGIAVLGHGLYRGSLPGASLNFRWQYWTASAQMVAEHSWFGVGRENFGRHYLKYKAIQSPEEVSNPHNLLVQAAADWGLVGLAGVMLMLVGGSWVVTYCGTRAVAPGFAVATFPQAKSAVALALVTGVLVIGGRAFLLGSSDPNYVYYVTTMSAIAWSIGFAAVWLRRSMGGGMVADASPWDRTNPPTACSDQDRGSPTGPAASSAQGCGMSTGPTVYTAQDCVSSTGIAIGLSSAQDCASSSAMAIGLFAFLLTEMVNFALFVPASAVTFFALLAVRLAGCSSRMENRSSVAKSTLRPKALESPSALHSKEGESSSALRPEGGRSLPGALAPGESPSKSPAQRADERDKIQQLEHDQSAGATTDPPRPRSISLVVQIATGVALCLVAGAIMFWSIGVVRSTQALAHARYLASNSLPTPGALLPAAYSDAAALNPLDPTPHAEQAAALIRVSEARSQPRALLEAERPIENAIQRDPYSIGLRRLKLHIVLTKARQSRLAKDFTEAVNVAREALALYPLDPAGLIALGDVLWESAEAATNDPMKAIELVLEAIEAWEQARDLNRARPAWELFHRLTPAEKEAVETRIARAHVRLTGQ